MAPSPGWPPCGAHRAERPSRRRRPLSFGGDSSLKRRPCDRLDARTGSVRKSLATSAGSNRPGEARENGGHRSATFARNFGDSRCSETPCGSAVALVALDGTLFTPAGSRGARARRGSRLPQCFGFCGIVFWGERSPAVGGAGGRGFLFRPRSGTVQGDGPAPLADADDRSSGNRLFRVAAPGSRPALSRGKSGHFNTAPRRRAETRRGRRTRGL